MLREDESLVRWAGQNLRSGVTFGQLVLLLELLGSASVAELSGANVGRAVNFRQKLARLERTLGLGPLTNRIGNSTQLSKTGEQVAGEVRLLLRELQAIEQSTVPSRTWTLGAGDAWLQSLIMPVLANMASSTTSICWEVRNLRTADAIRALKEGRLHFGFLRAEEVNAEKGLTKLRRYRGSSLAILVGNAAGAPNDTKQLLQWLLVNRRPFIQQGTTWKPLREQFRAHIPVAAILREIEPSVVCETHLQAAAAAAQSTSWCIVPIRVARLFSGDHLRLIEVLVSGEKDDMVLVTNARHTDKLPRVKEVIQSLKTGLGAAV